MFNLCSRYAGGVRFKSLKVFLCSTRTMILKDHYSFFKNFNFLKRPKRSKVMKSNLVSDGWTVIAVSNNYRLINFFHILGLIVTGLGVYNLTGYYRTPNWLEEKINGRLMNPYIGLIMLAHGLVILQFSVRSVRIIFRKNDQFKILTYGLLGPLNKKYLTVGLHEVIPPKNWYSFYRLRNASYVIDKYDFFYEKDFHDLCLY